MKKSISLYIAIAYGLIIAAGLAFYLLHFSYSSPAGTILATCCMFFPLIATLVCQKVEKKPLFRGLGISWKVNRWWFAGWFFILALALLTLLFSYWIGGPDSYTLNSVEIQNACRQTGVSPTAFVAITILSGMLMGITINALVGFGEEIGWRGYLLQQLQGKSFISAAVIIGIIWGLWHAPIILMGHNYPEAPGWGILCMIAICIPMGFIFQYFRLKSGSVLVPAILHGTFNAFANMPYLFIQDVQNYNSFLLGGTGLAGFLSLLTACLLLFLFDRYITHDRLITSPLPALTTPEAPHANE